MRSSRKLPATALTYQIIPFATLLLALGAPAALAQAPDPASVVARAVALEHGEGVARDPARAAALYCEAARAGHAEAQFNLGWMLANARGIPRDDAQASYFFELAAKQGHVHAERMLRQVGPPASEPPPCMAPPVVAAASTTEEVKEQDTPIVASTPAQQRVVEILNRLAPEYGVHPRLAFAVIRAESNFEPGAISPKNAQGLMQLIPETSARFNVTKPFDPEQNIRGGLSYLRWLLAYFKGSVPLVAAAYNAGEGTVNKYKGVPPYAETRGYVRRIIEVFRKREHPYDPRVTEPSPELSAIRVAGQM